MSHPIPNFKTKDDETKFLTLSEIFTDVQPEQIIDKLNEAHGDVQGAIEKILSAKGGSTPRPVIDASNLLKFFEIILIYPKNRNYSCLLITIVLIEIKNNRNAPILQISPNPPRALKRPINRKRI